MCIVDYKRLERDGDGRFGHYDENDMCSFVASKAKGAQGLMCRWLRALEVFFACLI